MSAWRVGTGLGPTLEAAGPGDKFKSFVDKITVWIPGDVIALYVAGVALLLEGANGGPSVPFLIVMAVVTPIIVLFGAWAAGNLTAGTWLRALLAVFAFLVWSLTVPGSGWRKWSAVADNPEWTTIIAALAGLLFGLLAEKITPSN